MKKLILVILGLTLATAMFAAQAATMVPPGNRNAEQPNIPGASSRRTQATNTTFQAKYRKVYALLQNDATPRTSTGWRRPPGGASRSRWSRSPAATWR